MRRSRFVAGARQEFLDEAAYYNEAFEAEVQQEAGVADEGADATLSKSVDQA